MVIPLILFAMAALIFTLSSWAYVLLNRQLLGGGYGLDAENAARTCLEAADANIGLTSAGTNPYSTCTSGQFFNLSGTNCYDDVSDSASSTLPIGDSCDCSIMLETTNATTFTVNAVGRCWDQNGSQANPDSQVIINADVATGTPGCVPNCTARNIPQGSDCSDGCGSPCTDVVCLIGGPKVLHCKANPGVPPPTFGCFP